MLLQSTSRSPDEPWEIRCYLRESGKNDALAWHAKFSTKGKVKVRTRLHYLRFQPQERWTRPEAAALKNNVAVIHVTDENGSKHRLTGYFDHRNHAFVICVLGYEKDDVYYPPDYEERTRRCRDDVGDDFDQRTAKWPWPIH